MQQKINPSDEEICEILKTAKTIAVVGLSSNKDRTSRQVAEFLVSKNYKVVGVNPAAPIIDGIPVYKSLSEIPFKIDIVDVFRRSEFIPDLIPEIQKVKPKVLWLQLGIRNDKAVSQLNDKNIIVIQDACVAIQHNYCW
ncbi:MAG: CoA-binding protein [Ignavibacteriae bacterium]|nr:CoA-binding protein [Ignavibacteriota bacterium]